MIIKKVILTILVTVLFAGCSSGGGGTTSPTPTTSSSSASAKGKAASAAISTASGSGSSSSSTGGSGTVASLSRDAVSKGITLKILDLHNSPSSSSPALLSLSYNGTDTITFTNEQYSISGGTINVSGSITLTSSTSGTTTTYSLINSSLTFDMSNVSESKVVDGNTYNITLSGSAVFTLTGDMVVTGSSLSSFNFAFAMSSNSLATSGDVVASFPSVSYSANVTQSGYSCSGSVSYSLDTGETGSCSVSSNCETCA